MTPGTPASIRLTPETEALKADGQSLLYVQIDVVDAEGNRIPNAEEIMTAEVTGVATLAALGAATPVTEELYTSGTFTSYKGRLLAIVRSGYESGEAKLTVRSERFGTQELTIPVE